MRIALAVSACIAAATLAGCLIQEPNDDPYGGSSGWGPERN